MAWTSHEVTLPKPEVQESKCHLQYQPFEKGLCSILFCYHSTVKDQNKSTYNFTRIIQGLMVVEYLPKNRTPPSSCSVFGFKSKTVWIKKCESHSQFSIMYSELALLSSLTKIVQHFLKPFSTHKSRYTRFYTSITTASDLESGDIHDIESLSS